MIMDKPAFSSYLRHRIGDIVQKKQPGPYITLSRQYGCDGLELAVMLVEKLNQRDEQHRWKLYHRDMLTQLAQDTGQTAEILEKERFLKPGLMSDFLRGLMRSDVPGSYEIRKNITTMIRAAAVEGYAVIMGLGGTAATADLGNGISVQIEAPEEWRIARVGVREQLSIKEATTKVKEIIAKRQYLREIYEKQNPRQPAFHFSIDNSIFNMEQIAELILLAMEQKGFTPKESPMQNP
jgi:hypothetical protein